MIKITKILAFILFIIVTISFSKCYNQEKYPVEPQIDIKQVIVTDSVDQMGNAMKSYTIFFKILDGDWDFGLTENDTLYQHYGDSTYLNNFFAKLYYLNNGNEQEYPMPLDFTGAIPYVDPVGLNNYYKAMIIYNLQMPRLGDTLKLKFYVIDRSLNKSNEQETPWIEPDFTGIKIDTVTIISD
jgi:hypothetical protein